MNKFLVKNPIISEKAMLLGKDRKYVFLVDQKATVSEVKKIIESNYNVKVLRTNSINVHGKTRRLGAISSQMAGYKKIIVTLQEGQKLDIIPK